jgi:G:T-mismatch repair DNA endonuclease (very short patch repair protein)
MIASACGICWSPTVWAAKVARNQERDRLADQALAEAGWTVIRIWEHGTPEAAAGERRPALLESVWPVNAGLAIGGRAGSLFSP